MTFKKNAFKMDIKMTFKKNAFKMDIKMHLLDTCPSKNPIFKMLFLPHFATSGSKIFTKKV
jgi:hypothetical protein